MHLSWRSLMPRTGSRQARSCELSWCIARRVRGGLRCVRAQSSAFVMLQASASLILGPEA